MLNTWISRLNLTYSGVQCLSVGQSQVSLLEEKFPASSVPRGILIFSGQSQPGDPESRDSRHLQEWNKQRPDLPSVRVWAWSTVRHAVPSPGVLGCPWALATSRAHLNRFIVLRLLTLDWAPRPREACPGLQPHLCFDDGWGISFLIHANFFFSCAIATEKSHFLPLGAPWGFIATSSCLSSLTGHSTVLRTPLIATPEGVFVAVV